MAGKTIEKMIDEQVKKWELTRIEKKVEEEIITVFTISREPGSGGRIIARELSENLDLDLFHQEILHEMAKNAKVIELEEVVVKFAGDSGDGMQLTGSQFSDSSAFVGLDLSTFPDYPAEIRAPQGSLISAG